MSDCYSNYLRDKINDIVHGGTTIAATTYFALMTVAPTASGGGTEVTIGVGSYARVSVTNNSSNWPNSSGQTKSNANAINWGTATGNWGTIVAIAEYDASTGGNLITFASLATAVTVNTGQPFQVPANGAVFNWAA
jgi:hypothetical protein